jgi:signal transduction histidine kinase
VSDGQPTLLSNLPASRGQQRLALGAAGILFLAFLLPVCVPDVQLPASSMFIVLVATVTLVVDLLSASLLFMQFSVTGSSGLAALASGYLLSSLLMIPYMLTFPGTLSASGLLGAGLQTAPWVFIVWHTTAPLSVVAYALLKRRGPLVPRSSDSLHRSIVLSVLVVIALVCAVTWFVTAKQALLPILLQDQIHPAPFWRYPPGFMVALNLIAFVVLIRRTESVMDLWLLVQSWSWLLESLLLHFVHSRFDLGYYTARIFWVTSSSFVLLVLLSQLAVLNMRVALSSLLQRRRREESLATLELFSASLAHELRQPLAAITWNSDAAANFLSQSTSPSENVSHCLREISHSASHAAQAIDAVRGLFRRGPAGSERQPFDLNELLLEVVEILRNDIEALRISVQFDLAPVLPAVLAHRTQLNQLVLNLLKNATDAMSLVCDRPRILRLGTQEQQSEGIVVSVGDSGVGIDPQSLDRVFDVFYSSKPDGMGMGLAICRSIVEAHGGRLWVESHLGQGSVFRFSLPAAAGAGALA